MLTVCSTSCWKWLSGRFIAQHFQGLLWDWEVWCFLDPCNMVGWCLHIIRPPFVTVTFESWQWFAVTSASSLSKCLHPTSSQKWSMVIPSPSFPGSRLWCCTVELTGQICAFLQLVCSLKHVSMLFDQACCLERCWSCEPAGSFSHTYLWFFCSDCQTFLESQS